MVDIQSPTTQIIGEEIKKKKEEEEETTA